MKLVLGSRGSKLAMWQAGWVKERMEAAGHTVEIKVIKTSGDRGAGSSLLHSGTKGLFVKELEEALTEGVIDLAVHSLKDLPVDQPRQLQLAAFPPREDARDALISRDGSRLEGLPPGARVGTGSLRRRSQLRSLRQDVCIVPMRGNVDTRIRKMREGECNAIVVAAAGLLRLGMGALVAQYFTLEELCPAVGQGALAVEIRRSDGRVKSAVEPLDDLHTRRAVSAERAALRCLGGGCQTPFAAHAWIDGGLVKIRGVIADPEGNRVIRAAALGPADDAETVGKRLAADLAAQDAGAILRPV